MDKETQDGLRRILGTSEPKTILEHIASLNAKADSIAKDMKVVRSEMVTKEYLRQALEALQADVSTKESVPGLVQAEKPKEDR